MKNLKKLSRDEMRTVAGGLGDCSVCHGQSCCQCGTGHVYCGLGGSTACTQACSKHLQRPSDR